LGIEKLGGTGNISFLPGFYEAAANLHSLKKLQSCSNIQYPEIPDIVAADKNCIFAAFCPL